MLRTREFCISLSQSQLEKPYSLTFKGVVEYWWYPPNPGADSDWDAYGYNEFNDLAFDYICKEEDESETFLRESDVERNDYECFSKKLNFLCEF